MINLINDIEKKILKGISTLYLTIMRKNARNEKKSRQDHDLSDRNGKIMNEIGFSLIKFLILFV